MKGLENGAAALSIDASSLRKGEAHYSTYFQQRKDLPLTAQGLVSFN